MSPAAACPPGAMEYGAAHPLALLNQLASLPCAANSQGRRQKLLLHHHVPSGRMLAGSGRRAHHLPTIVGRAEMGTSESYIGLRDRDDFHIMLNLDSFEDFLPTARELAERFLATARAQQDHPALERTLKDFPYSKQAFEARLDEIYEGLIEDVERYEARHSWTMGHRDDVIEWLHQMAPFNQTDGSWLRNIASIGADRRRALLAVQDLDRRAGQRDPKLNHPNMYTDLLDSVGIHLPDVRSCEYAEDPRVLDSAFTLPLLCTGYSSVALLAETSKLSTATGHVPESEKPPRPDGDVSVERSWAQWSRRDGVKRSRQTGEEG